MVKNYFEQVRSMGLGLEQTSLNLVDWHYRITNEEWYKGRETSLKDFQQQQQLKWISRCFIKIKKQ